MDSGIETNRRGFGPAPIGGLETIVATMKDRPLCAIDGCDRVAKKHKRRSDGSWIYRSLCNRHHNERYGRSNANAAQRKKEQIDNSKCFLCGWDRGPCDRHRIKAGKDGGKYIQDNVISICPNCHRLLHLGLLGETERTSFLRVKQFTIAQCAERQEAKH